ncbi:MAG: hypothetical protein EBZ48_07400 [Proteobacteria bacterium]|nr:hypothetical protein [Pseudomonadota bacterium]
MSKQQNETTVFIAFDDYVSFDPAKPEKELLRAILVNAISDLKKPGELSRRAREYFLSTEEDYLFSFRSVCNFLNVDPRRILRVTGLQNGGNPIVGRTSELTRSEDATPRGEPVLETVES